MSTVPLQMGNEMVSKVEQSLMSPSAEASWAQGPPGCQGPRDRDEALQHRATEASGWCGASDLVPPVASPHGDEGGFGQDDGTMAG